MSRDSVSPNEAQPLRRVALKLATLRDSDRRWILRRLQPSDRDRLKALIRQAVRFAARGAQEVLPQLLQDAAANPVSAPASKSTRRTGGERIATQTMVAVTSQLPLACAALLSESRPGPWTSFLERRTSEILHGPLRGLIEEARKHVTDAFVLALSEAVDGQVAADSNSLDEGRSAFEALVTSPASPLGADRGDR